MEWLLQNPLALWMVIGAVFLAIEVATSSGWLLWPAGAAVLTGAALQILPLGLEAQLIVFAALTIVTTLAGRRFFPPNASANADINDNQARLVGSEGVVAEDFRAGLGRVFVEGKEWAGELEGGGTLPAGARVMVTDVGSARLTVRAA